MESKKTYSCLIIDDEALARQLIQNHLSKFPNIEIIQNFGSAVEAAAFFKNNTVDLLFLDIQMPKLSGIDFLKSLINPPKVIFTTAYSEFALEGYELNVIDYILKPITFERFEKAVNKVVEILNLENNFVEKSTTKIEETSIVIKSSHQLIKIEIADIIYIEGLHKYIKIVTKDKTYTTLFSLTAIENELPNSQFYRCHRSFIINLTKLKLIDGHQAILENMKVPISKTNKAELVTKMGKQIG